MYDNDTYSGHNIYVHSTLAVQTCSAPTGRQPHQPPALSTIATTATIPTTRHDVASSRVSDHPDVWTDGSFVRNELSGVGVGGCGVYSSQSGVGWFHRRWGHLELLPPDDHGVERCVLFDSVRGPLQSVQRAELWGVILALQCSSAIHLGVDNLNVVRHVSRFLEGRASVRPLELTVDGDLLIIIERMIRGVILSCCLLMIMVLSVVSCLILFAVLFSMFNVLNFGV